MSSLSAKSHRCSTCGAPLALENARDEILRCRYCGSDHRVICAKAEAEAELRAERRVGAIAAPYLIGPFLGLATFFAVRDFLWSPYGGGPAMAVSFAFLIIGFMSFRMPAALGLAAIGLAGIAKPFVRPVAGFYGGEVHYFTATSETSFYFLVPGIISAIAAFLFFSSLKVRELGPASRALIPRPSMAVATALGVAAGYFILGDTGISLARENRHLVDEMLSIADAACSDELPTTLKVPLEPPPKHVRYKDGNVLLLSCMSLREPGVRKSDPLYVDDFAWFLQQADARRPELHKGAKPWMEDRYSLLSKTRYVIAYRSDGDARVAIIADREARTAHVVSGVALANSQQLFAALTSVAGGSFPEGTRRSVGSVSSVVSKAEPATPVSAEFELSTTSTNSIGSLWFYGFVTNTSTIATDAPEVLVTLLDADGREVRSEHAYGRIPLEPGARAPVAIMVSKPPEYTSYEFETVARRLSGVQLATGLRLIDTTQNFEGKTLHFSGKVRNDGDQPAKFVNIHTLQFGPGDELIGLHSTYAKTETLEVGAEARFLDKIYGWDPETMRIEHIVTGNQGRR